MLYTNKFAIAFIAATTATAVLGVPIRGLENGGSITNSEHATAHAVRGIPEVFANIMSPRDIGIPDANQIARRKYITEMWVRFFMLGTLTNGAKQNSFRRDDTQKKPISAKKLPAAKGPMTPLSVLEPRPESPHMNGFTSVLTGEPLTEWKPVISSKERG
jgi:hypothetical protein